MTAAWEFPHELVERVESPVEASFWRGRIRMREPVVLAGGARHWDADGVWSLRALASAVGDEVVHVEVSPNGRFPADVARLHLATITLRELAVRAEQPRAGEHLSLSHCSMREHFPALLGRVGMPACVAAEPSVEAQLCVDAAGNQRHLGYDGANRLVAQLQGRRHFLLFAPRDSGRLYRHPLWRPDARFSRVDVIEPDFTRFPRFEDAMPMCCTLEAGDVLFVPAFWWRETHCPQACVAVSLCWKPDWKALLHYRQFHWELASSALGRLVGVRERALVALRDEL